MKVTIVSIGCSARYSRHQKRCVSCDGYKAGMVQAYINERICVLNIAASPTKDNYRAGMWKSKTEVRWNHQKIFFVFHNVKFLEPNLDKRICNMVEIAVN